MFQNCLKSVKRDVIMDKSEKPIPKQAVALLGPDDWVALKLIKRTQISPDSFIFRFELPSPHSILGLPIGQNIQIRADNNGEEVIRAYTPISGYNTMGYMDLLIKVYFKNVLPEFPKGGLISQYIHSLSIGQTLDVRGPTGRMLYYGKGSFGKRPDKVSDYTPGKIKRINMIAGGSGITPMLQLIRAILSDSEDFTTICLLFANRTEADILCREDLEKYHEEAPHKFKLWYTLSKAPEDWKYGKGHIDADMISSQLYGPSEDTLTLICGPPAMIESACHPNLDKLGYSRELRHVY